MNTTLVASLVSAAIGAGAAWTIQDNRITHLELEHANERISIQRAARASIERAVNQAAAAQSAAATRAASLRRTAVDARGVLDGLLQSTDATVRTSPASADACLERTVAIGGLFNQCARELQTLAERCDRHVSDIKTLTESWPK